MLRDFVYHPGEAELRSTLAQFDISLNEQQSQIGLISFLVVSPDSFLWKLRIDNNVYYLYAEDYVVSLDSVKTSISQRAGRNVTLEFILARKVKNLTDTSSYKAAVVYETPNDTNNIMRYAVDSGHDLVFLCKSNEDSNEAYFN